MLKIRTTELTFFAVVIAVISDHQTRISWKQLQTVCDSDKIGACIVNKIEISEKFRVTKSQGTKELTRSEIIFNIIHCHY